MFKKVLLLSASAGAGHIRAAQAIERALIEMNAAEEVRHVDALEYTNKLFRTLYSKAYIELVNRAPEAMGWLYDQLDTPWENERRRLALNKLNARPFIKMVEEFNADICISTHFLPAELISWLKAKNRLTCPQAVVVTDFDAHAMWLCHHYEQYFVALDETRVYLEKLGIAPHKISVTGIPIDPIFSRRKDKYEMRVKHKLKADVPTILVSAGGFGVGPIKQILQSLLYLKHQVQVIAICGRNEELKSEIQKIADELPADHPVAIKPIGYTTEMDEYMTATEILLGKPGGLTTSEALAMGLVFVIVNPIPGQEERNSDHLLENGAAIRCNNLPVLAYKIDRLLDDQERFKKMQANALKLAHPRAAFDIVEKLLALKRSSARTGKA
jgi:processive 1,2-diacylglycerol beta-glucosyltransferase